MGETVPVTVRLANSTIEVQGQPVAGCPGLAITPRVCAASVSEDLFVVTHIASGFVVAAECYLADAARLAALTRGYLSGLDYTVTVAQVVEKNKVDRCYSVARDAFVRAVREAQRLASEIDEAHEDALEAHELVFGKGRVFGE